MQKVVNRRKSLMTFGLEEHLQNKEERKAMEGDCLRKLLNAKDDKYNSRDKNKPKVVDTGKA